jgi:phosphatidylglycerol lysyltransferase
MRWLGPIISVCLLAATIWFLNGLLATVRLDEVVTEFQTLPLPNILIAIFCTAVSYFLLAFYDVMGLKHLGYKLPFSKVAGASFISTAFSHNLGLGFLTGGSVRYRMYSASGLSGLDVATIQIFSTVTFDVGIAVLAGVTLLFEPAGVIAGIPDMPEWLGRGFGIACVLAVGVYGMFCAFYRDPIDVRGMEFRFPTFKIAVGQVVLSVVDIMLTAMVMYVLLPELADTSWLVFLGAFVIAILLGALSHLPGGIGVIETALVLLLPNLPPETVLASALAYRVIYYLLPFAVAAVMVIVAEVAERRAIFQSFGLALGNVLVRFAPQISGAFVLLAGAVLLISGASPSTDARLGALEKVVPLALIEASHLLASVAGVLLLILARGLLRRLDAAYFLAIGALSAGIVFSLLKGFDYEEAIILSFVLVLVVSSRAAFYRKTSLLSEPFTPGWLLTIAVLVGAATWIGFFAYRHVEYSNDLWWTFAFNADAPRFLRAMFVVTGIALVATLYQAMRPVRPILGRPSSEDLEAAKKIVARTRSTDANLALLGDKQFLFSEARNGFVMYGVQGGSMIAMGDPVAFNDSTNNELAWSFRELCDHHDRRPVFYQVSENYLSQYIDMGLSLQKLGEEAIIPLQDFSLEGSKRRDLRQPHARALRDGLTFEVVPVEGVPAIMNDIRAVSDAWLSEKSTREKGFSIGAFSETYVSNFPCAVVRAAGRIVGFATVWTGGTKEELSVDLMRHIEDAPYGVMDFLFVEMMLWGKANNYQYFNMGLAPLSGLESHPLAPVWHRAGAFIFKHGENFYNFEGLRRYKSKFQPQWRAKYIATQGGLNVAAALFDVSTLISGGLRGLVTK